MPSKPSGLRTRTAFMGVFQSHRLVLRVYFYDTAGARIVTDEGSAMAGRAFRAAPRPPAGGGLPDARLAHRGRRRGPGGLAETGPRRRQRGRESWRVADDDRRACDAEKPPRASRQARRATRSTVS